MILIQNSVRNLDFAKNDNQHGRAARSKSNNAAFPGHYTLAILSLIYDDLASKPIKSAKCLLIVS
jgi:hypothetical protein